jgi:hypothetical protein
MTTFAEAPPSRPGRLGLIAIDGDHFDLATVQQQVELASAAGG